MDIRSNNYAKILSRLIGVETISVEGQKDKTKFYNFQRLLRECFPCLFERCVIEDFNGSLLLRLKGKSTDNPIMLMNHHDVVEAPGEWRYPPFEGKIVDGKVWGRGTLDTKGGLFCMLQACEELVKDGFTPERDVYFLSSSTEECDGTGAQSICKALKERGIEFKFVLDEGGMIASDPIPGAKGKFALIGVGEKGCADIKFIARSSGGHASTPPKDNPLVRIAKFVSLVERKNLFKAKMSPTVCELFTVLGKSMKGVNGVLLRNCKLYKGTLAKILPILSPAAGAMLKTTVAFTMAKGSEGANVIPHEAYVVANVRYSHHQGKKSSIDALKRVADKFDIEMVVLDGGIETSISDYHSDEFKFIKDSIKSMFDGVHVTPYVMNGASDCRYADILSKNCFRFTPFIISDKQLDSIHGIDENVDISNLAPAVDFYKKIIKEG